MFYYLLNARPKVSHTQMEILFSFYHGLWLCPSWQVQSLFMLDPKLVRLLTESRQWAVNAWEKNGKEWAANRECLPADVKEATKINFYKNQMLACYSLVCYLKTWKGNLDVCIKISNQWVAQPGSLGVLGNHIEEQIMYFYSCKKDSQTLSQEAQPPRD